MCAGLTLTPLRVLLFPKFHLYLKIFPTPAVEPLPSKVTDWPTWAVVGPQMAAVGGCGIGVGVGGSEGASNYAGNLVERFSHYYREQGTFTIH